MSSSQASDQSPSMEPRAHKLDPQERKDIAVKALSRSQSITEIAQQESVSRKFVYQQVNKADDALDEAFSASSDKSDDDVLFYFPVTKKTIRMIVLALILLCHSAYRGVIEFLKTIFDYHISLGTVHNIVKEATKEAKSVNESEDISKINILTLDEIFQGDPVLVAVEPFSSYCCLLAQESHRDATTWGVHLLDLSERGVIPDHTIADGGKGIRAGQAEAWPDISCWGDTFHAQMEVTKMTTYLDNRAYGAINTLDKLDNKMERAKKKAKGQTLSKKLALARNNETVTVELAGDMRLLSDWLAHDVLSISGPDIPTRRELFDFIVAEMKDREHFAPHRIRPVRVMLENQRDDLLAFVAALDQSLEQLSHKYNVQLEDIRMAFELYRLSESDPLFWQEDANLWKRLGDNYWAIKQDIKEIMEQMVRASSMVENLNSRLRCYFFLRRNLGPDYLELLKFFLNHHRFARSRKKRGGKSPAEILSGTTLPHWLEQLGFTLFKRAA